MRYYALLRVYIKASGLSLSEIADRLKDYGFSIDKSYISKLQTGKTGGPATDELNRALAAVTGGNVEELLSAALYEKAPAELKEKLERLDTLKGLNGEYQEANEKLYATSKALQKAKLSVKDAENDYEHLTKLDNIIRIPVLGHIAAGRPLFADGHVLDWELIPKPGNYKEGDLFALIVKGDSMIGARIYDGDKVVVRVQQEVEDGEIAVVNVDGENATLKRFKRINGEVLLISENPKYDPIVIKSEKARVCGKVIQVIFDPNGK